jgi:hypothetical protein
MAWFKVVTNYREFTLEAAGIGDAIDTVLNSLLVKDRGEYLRTVEPTAPPALQVAA